MLLGGFRLAALGEKLLIVEGWHPGGTVELGETQADAGAVEEQIGTVGAGAAPKIGEGDDGKLKAFGGVNGQKADGILAAGDGRLGLGVVEGVELVIDVIEKAAQIAPLLGFEAVREAQELVDIGEATGAVGQREEVLLVGGEAKSAAEQLGDGMLRSLRALGSKELDEVSEALPLLRVQACAQLGGRAQKHLPDPMLSGAL